MMTIVLWFIFPPLAILNMLSNRKARLRRQDALVKAQLDVFARHENHLADLAKEQYDREYAERMQAFTQRQIDRNNDRKRNS